MHSHKRLQNHTNLFTHVFIHALRSCSFVLIDRCMMERTLHPVSLATLHVMASWVISSIVHPIACGWSSTATLLELIRASASHTQVSCLRNLNKLLRNTAMQNVFHQYLLTPTNHTLFIKYGQRKKPSLTFALKHTKSVIY